MSVAARSTAVMPTPALRQGQAACARQHNTDYRRATRETVRFRLICFYAPLLMLPCCWAVSL
jgi:hypothetical protein